MMVLVQGMVNPALRLCITSYKVSCISGKMIAGRTYMVGCKFPDEYIEVIKSCGRRICELLVGVARFLRYNNVAASWLKD